MGLSLTDQAFIQQMMCEKALSAEKTVEVYNSCLARAKKSTAIKARDISAVQRRMDKMNDNLSGIGLQFKTIFSPWENTTFWGLCNTLEDAAVPTSSVLKKNENAAFFDLIEVLQDSDGIMPLVTAHNLVAKEHNMSVMDASNLMQKLNQQKWLKISRKQSGAVNITLGARALLELPRIRSWVIQKNLNLGEVAKPENEEEEYHAVGAPPSGNRGSPADRIEESTRRERRPSRRVAYDDSDEDMEIEPAPRPSQSRRTRARLAQT